MKIFELDIEVHSPDAVSSDTNIVLRQNDIGDGEPAILLNVIQIPLICELLMKVYNEKQPTKPRQS